MYESSETVSNPVEVCLRETVSDVPVCRDNPLLDASYCET